MKNLIPLIVLIAIALGVSSKAGTSGPPCLTHMEMAAITSDLDYSDETINYVFWGVVGGTLDEKTFVLDIETLYATNNSIRYNLGLPLH